MSIQADTRSWRAAHRRYGVRVPLDEVPQHLVGGYTIIDDAEDIRADVLMRPPEERRAA